MNLDPTQKSARDQFSRQSAKYGKAHILADVTDVEAALDDLPPHPGKDALDVATGGGHTALCLAKHGFNVTLSDISPAMLEHATALLADAGFAPAGTHCHAAEEFPFENASFDLVTCRVAAHHFSNPEKFVSEASRVLRPGGALIVIDGSIDDGQPISEEWTHQVEKLRDPSHGRFLTPAIWNSICHDADLQVLECVLRPMKMPDLDWYFETAATPEANREAVRTLVREAPEQAKELFQITESETGTITWHWRRLTLVAKK